MITATHIWKPAAVILVLALTELAARPDPELKIAVNATTIESFPAFLAADTFTAENSGHQVQLVVAPNGRAAMAQLVSGSVDAATGSEMQALLNSAADPRLRIVVTLAECRYRIVARRSAGIRRIAELRGRKIAATANTSSQYFLAAMLRTANLEESSVHIVALEGQEMAAALKNGSVDAVSIWEPHAQNALEAIGDDAAVFEDRSAYTERFNLNTRADVLSNPARRTALTRFMRAILTASARLRARPAELLPSLAPRVGVTERTVLAVWRQFKYPADLSKELWPSMERIEPWIAATQNRRARSRQDLESLIDRSVLTEAQKQTDTRK